jgi:hypothetical protein
MENTQDQQPNNTTELSVSDLQALKTLVETAVRRGAFQANELTAVGTVYDRVNTFLSSISTK